MKYETRYIAVDGVEVRLNADGTRTFTGRAAVYDTPTMIGSGRGAFREKVAPTAMQRAIAERQDVRHLINHNADLLLGRTASGTTRLESRDGALCVETDMPDTSYARDLEVLAQRGDLTQMSFGFRVPKGGDSWAKGADGIAERTLTDIDLLDVSSVTFPAYPETTGEVRSMAASLRADLAWDVEDGFSDWQSDISASLPAGGWGYVIDLAGDRGSVLLCWYADEASESCTYVAPVVVGDDGEPAVGPQSDWQPVEQQYVDSASVVADMEANGARLRDLEARAGKVLSDANAEHLNAALAAHADSLSHLQAIADSAGLADDANGGDNEDMGDDALKGEGNSAAAGEARREVLSELRLLELQAHFDARR